MVVWYLGLVMRGTMLSDVECVAFHITSSLREYSDVRHYTGM